MLHKFNLIEHILLYQNIIPHPLVDAGTNLGLSRALTTAVKLKVTDELSDTPKPASTIANKLALSEKGVTLLLDCLEALDYVEKSGSGYKFSKRGKKFLDQNSPDSFRNMVLFGHRSFETFTNLAETVRNGEPKQTNLETFDDYDWEIFSRAMIELSRTNLDEVTKKIKPPANAQKLIDLGGSHGLYSIELCKKKDGMTATILDFEPVRKYTEECANEHNMGDRVKFQKCDFAEEEIPGGNDMALMFNIIHGFNEKKNLEIFKKVAGALNDGGQLIVLDQIKGTGGKSQLARATTSFMALNLFQQAGGNTYTFDEVKNWALEAGFKSAKLDKLRSPGFGLITCEK